MRFVKKTSVTPDGEIADKQVYDIDEEQIQKEEMYDGFYAVITNLEGDVSEIIRINKQRWEIEENFRIMKTEFEARPVYVRREDRIKAHFMTCYISLLLYRLLEKKLGDAYTVSQILGTLRSMQMTLLNTASGYIPSYTRTELTLCTKHLALERIMNSLQKPPCEQLLKKRNRLSQKNHNIAHIVTKRKTATEPMFTGFVAIFYLSNCQRWDYSTICKNFNIFLS